MKTMIGLLIVLTTNVLNDATFTFHAAKDNWTEISVLSDPLPCNPVRGYQSYVIGYWDFGWDAAFPSEAYSGLDGEQIDCAGDYTQWMVPSGYSDTLTFTVSDSIAEVDVWLSGPYPDYANGQMNFDLQRQPQGGVDLVSGGEVWIDFGPDSIGRIELLKPADFGKWAWDGGVNPSWVEPVPPVTNKKQHGKGHAK